MELKEWMDYLIKQQEHYPVSDEFIKKYQQSPNNHKGYIYYAWETGHIIDRNLAEPNQKWHFFESYILRDLLKEKKRLNDSAKKIYSGIKCPELLIWLAEASCVDKTDVIEVFKAASQAQKEKLSSSQIAKIIRDKITWEKIEENIRAKGV